MIFCVLTAMADLFQPKTAKVSYLNPNCDLPGDNILIERVIKNEMKYYET